MNNTVKRSISGVCFLAIVISGLLLNKYLYAALLVFMMVTMLYEFYHMTMGDRFPRSRWLAAITSNDGRHLAMMPHLERAFLPWQWPYYPDDRKDDEVTPWLEAFVNARNWVDKNRKKKK